MMTLAIRTVLLFIGVSFAALSFQNCSRVSFSPVPAANVSTLSSQAGCANGATNPPTCTTFPACTNGATNPPACTAFPTCANGATNPPICTELAACTNGATNPPTCTSCPAAKPNKVNGQCIANCANGASNPPTCTSFPPCTNGATNPPTCNVFPPCTNGATNPPACNVFPPCANGANNPPTCTTFPPCPNGANNPPACNTYSPCTNSATNPPTCNVFPPCTNGATNPPSCNVFPPCTNGALNPPTCTNFPPCTNGATNPPTCNSCPSSAPIFSNNQCVATCTNGATNPPTCTTCPVGQRPNATTHVCEAIVCGAQSVQWGQTLACAGTISGSGIYHSTSTTSSNSASSGNATFMCSETGWIYQSGICQAACIDNSTYTFAWDNASCQALHTPVSTTHGQKSQLYTIDPNQSYSLGATGNWQATCYDGKLINTASTCKPDQTVIAAPNCPATTFYWNEGQVLPNSVGATCWGTAPSTVAGALVEVGNINTDIVHNSGYAGSVGVQCDSSGSWNTSTGVVGCAQLKGIPQPCKGPVNMPVGSCNFTFAGNMAHGSSQEVYNSTPNWVGKIQLTCNDGIWWLGPESACAQPTDPMCSSFDTNLSLKAVDTGALKSYNFITPASYRLTASDPNSLGLGAYIFTSTTDPGCYAHVACLRNSADSSKAIWDEAQAQFSGTCSKP